MPSSVVCTTTVYRDKGSGFTLKELADFIQEAYDNGFTPNCIPTANGYEPIVTIQLQRRT